MVTLGRGLGVGSGGELFSICILFDLFHVHEFPVL